MAFNGQAHFKKSSYSGTRRCVGVAITDETVFITNTKQPNLVIPFTRDEWKAFIDGVKNNEFDIGTSKG